MPRPNTVLPAGTRAPDFDLPVNSAEPPPPGRPLPRISLRELAGRPVVLVFYPGDFTPVCSSELAIYNELHAEFEDRFRARVLGISVDSVWCHRAFARELNLKVPLLADFHPKGEVSQRYASYRESDGFSERSLYVIGGDGVIFWSHLSPLDVNPGADGVLDALERMSGAAAGGDARP